jgi:catechol 2,3-dioxygenase-like lactoylglutathione lyase family enzyme
MGFSRIITNICSDRLTESRDFYVTLLGFEISYESDWYIQLRNPIDREMEFGIILRHHALVPPAYQTAPTGMYVTFVVPEVDRIYQQAVNLGLVIVQEPRNEFYGQRRFLTRDPNGCLLDICSPWSESEQ